MGRFINLFLLLQFTTVSAFGQILFSNPSFEGSPTDSCWVGNIPNKWNTCNYNSIANCKPRIESHPDTVIDGLFCLVVSSCDFSRVTISQQLNCSIIPGVTYTGTLSIANYYSDYFPTFFNRGICRLGLSMDSCVIEQPFFEEGPLDTAWVQYQYTFTPDSAYPWFLIENKRHIGSSCANLMVDAMSPIYVLNAHQVHSYTTDTLLPIGSTACLNLNGYADTTYNRVWWEQVGVGLLNNQLNAGTYCTDTNTTYIIHMLGQDSTCAGYLPSSDTVRVRFYDPNAVTQPETAALLKIYPNPAANYITITAEVKGTLTLHDGLGRLVVTKIIEPSNASLSIEDLPGGVYCYRFTSSNKIMQYGKIVKQ
jgi:hypothetical protein